MRSTQNLQKRSLILLDRLLTHSKSNATTIFEVLIYQRQVSSADSLKMQQITNSQEVRNVVDSIASESETIESETFSNRQTLARSFGCNKQKTRNGKRVVASRRVVRYHGCSATPRLLHR